MRNKKIFWLFNLLTASYLLTTLLTPTETSVLLRYGLSETEATLLELTVTLPIVAIWYVAYYGWSKVSNYAHGIKDTREGIAFQKISNGLLALVLWLPLNTTLSTLFRNIYTNNEALTTPLVIANNYLTIALLIVATALLSRGAFELKSFAKKGYSWSFMNASWLILGVLSFMYVYVTLSNPYRQFPGDSGTASYYLPDWLLAPTIILPYLVVFYLGLRAVQYLHVYRYSVNGILYKNALKNIANGVGVSILSVLGIRYLVSVNTILDDAALKLVLAIIYIFLLVIAVGFLLIAKGAKQLHKIEEI